MGSVFRYIADHALTSADEFFEGICQVCNKKEVEVFEVSGTIALEDGKLGEDVYAACGDCIRGGRIEKTGADVIDAQVRKYLKGIYKDRTPIYLMRRSLELSVAYRQTPDSPLFVQNPDWPLCCGDLTEFTGSPASETELIRLTRDGTYWQERVETNNVNFEKTGPPECLREVSRFECLNCHKCYWTWQFT